MKVILFGTSLWPQCDPVKEALSQNNIVFDYIDISASIMNLKKFLRIRDISDAHEEVRKKHSVGVPCIMAGDQIYIAETPAYVEKLIEEGKIS